LTSFHASDTNIYIADYSSGIASFGEHTYLYNEHYRAFEVTKILTEYDEPWSQAFVSSVPYDLTGTGIKYEKIPPEESKLIITEAKTDKEKYLFNEEVKISCIVKDESETYVSTADVKAEITKPDSSKEVITLSEIEPGIYEGIFINTTLEGTYNVTIQAEKQDYAKDTANLSFIVEVSLEILDGVDFSAGMEISSNPEKLASGGTAVTGAVTDGVTRLLLRLNLSELNEVTFSLKGTGNPEEDGLLRSIDGTQEGQSITVYTQETSEGEIAFAIYQAPENFVRWDYRDKDKKVSERTITLHVKSNRDPSFEFSTEIKLVRPPVILVHGLWSGVKMWEENYFRETLANEWPGIHIFTPGYPNDVHFKENKTVPYECENEGGISDAKEKLQSQGIAMIQADVIGHSMGGLLARIWSGEGDYLYKRDNNFWAGDINKLITLDSPHFGSFLTDFALDLINDLEEEERNAFLELAREKGFALDGGAVEDMMTTSPKIEKMNGVLTDPPSHAIAGDISKDLSSLEDTGALLYIILTSIEYNTGADILPDESDLVVSAESQAGGLALPKSSVFAHWHCDATGEDVVNKAIELLNTETDSSSFNIGFPVNQWP